MPNPDINTGDLVLVKDHTSKTFMPKYKSDFCVIRVLGNKVEIKDNNGKMSWYHISDVKKTDMVTKLIINYLIMMLLQGRKTQLQSRKSSRPWMDCK